MARHIYCKTCGEKFPPMDPEDVAMGWKERRVWQTVQKPEEHFITVDGKRTDIEHLICDGCNALIKDGEMALLISHFRGVLFPAWEHEYAVKTKPK